MNDPHSSGNSILVVRWHFRIIHVIMLLGSAFLAYSALGLDDDGRAINGALSMFFLHRYVGLAWGALLVLYGITRMAGRRVTLLDPLRKPIGEQVREGLSVVGRYFFGISISQRVRSKMGRHNVLAAYAFLGLVFGLLLLGVGGLGLVLLPGETGLSEVFIGIHILGAGLLVLFVLAHIFAVINKENLPLLKAAFGNGRISRDYLESHMPAFNAERRR